MNRQVFQMMNDPRFQQQFMQRMKSFDPSQVLDQIGNDPEMMKNPMVRSVMERRKHHDTEGLVGLAENVFRENGRDYGEFEKELKQQLGFR